MDCTRNKNIRQVEFGITIPNFFLFVRYRSKLLFQVNQIQLLCVYICFNGYIYGTGLNSNFIEYMYWFDLNVAFLKRLIRIKDH